jgi:hypothetical protein
MAEPKTIQVNLDTPNPLTPPQVEPIQAVEKDVVFVCSEDTELTINQTKLVFTARAPKKVTRDQARILSEAHKGYIMGE